MNALRILRTKLIYSLLVLPLLVGFFLSVIPAQAATSTTATASTATTLAPPTFNDIINQGLLKAGSSADCKSKGDCSITDMLQVVVNVMTLIFGISGSIFLLMFVLGGLTWMMSGGDAGSYKKGLDTLRDAVIGLIVVFGAYIAVNSLLSLVRTGQLPGPGQDLNTTLQKVTDTKTIEIQTIK